MCGEVVLVHAFCFLSVYLFIFHCCFMLFSRKFHYYECGNHDKWRKPGRTTGNHDHLQLAGRLCLSSKWWHWCWITSEVYCLSDLLIGVLEKLLISHIYRWKKKLWFLIVILNVGNFEMQWILWSSEFIQLSHQLSSMSF